MKQVFSIVCAAFLSMALLVTGCKKGDTGPEGPEGPAGPAGPGGPKGDAGTANVIYSNWLDVAYTGLTNQAGEVVAYADTMAIPKLDANMLSKGEIKVYINWGTAADPLVDPLPLNDPFYEIVITTTFEIGFMQMLANGNYSTGLDANNQKRQTYRYILIPGGTAARSAINWNDYAAVKEYLKIPD